MGKSKYSFWDEAVFEYRNKNYGAYPVRRSYPLHLSFAALIVIFLFLAGMLGPGLFSSKGIKVAGAKKVIVINYDALTAPPPIEKIYIPPKPRVIVQHVKVKKYLAPIVTKEEVKEPEQMMTISQVKKNMASTDNSVHGSKGTEMVVNAVSPPAEIKPAAPKIAIPPQFPGGDNALLNFLRKNLQYPPMAQEEGITGTVIIEFIVNMDGRLSDIKVVQSVDRSLDREAIHVVKLMPAWKPGISNTGEKIIAKRILPIEFVLQ